MPTYEYRCPTGHRFDVFQKMSDPPVATCPECGKPAERTISGGAGFLFKGEGFYITDYRSEDYKKKKASETPSEKQGSSKPESGAKSESSGAKESKAEAKPEPKPKKERRKSLGGDE